MAKTSSNDRMAEIVEKIEGLVAETGALPWTRPWVSAGFGTPVSGVTGKAYRGLNRWVLGTIGQIDHPNEPNVWMTYKQAAKEGGQIRKGEKSTMAVFWKLFEKRDKETGELKKIPFLQTFNVFHWTQADWADGEPREVRKARARAEAIESNDYDPVVEAEAIIASYLDADGPSFSTGGDRAFYSPSTDAVTVPELNQFTSVDAYYRTTFHELGHSTGAERRLNRDFGPTFGDTLYSREELVAELTATMLADHAGLSSEEAVQQSAAYIKHWMSFLKDDPMALSWAAGRAEKAVDLILAAASADEESITATTTTQEVAA